MESQFGDEFHQGRLLEAVRASGFIVAHNGKFELQWLARCGLEVGSVLVWDTMLAEFVLAGNRRWDLSLDGTAKRYGLGGKVSRVSALIAGGVCPSDIPEEWLLEYGKEDTSLTHQIFLKQRERLKEAGLLPVLYTRCLLTPVLADMEMRGFQLDPKRVLEEYEHERSIFGSLERDIASFSGEINWRSGKQVANFVYGELGFSELRRRGRADRTDGDNPRTDANTIESLKAANKEQRQFQRLYKDFRKSAKRLENLEKLKACVDEAEGLLYAQFNQSIAGTHRLTSNGLKYKVQYQNIDHTLKRLFGSRRLGWLVGEADGSQLEFRVGAHLGRDATALADIRDPLFDVHWQTAEAMHGVSREALTADDRREAKPFTFRPLYGAVSGTPEQKAYIKFFQERYSGINKTQEGWCRTVLRDKQLRTETGLIFYWPDTKLEKSRDGRGYVRNRTSIFNYPVQSLATADIIPIAVVYLWHRIRAGGYKMFLVNTVHDSVIAEVPADEADAFRSLSERCFTVDCCDYLARVYDITFTVPLGCETKVGTHWSEGESRKFDYDPQLKKVA